MSIRHFPDNVIAALKNALVNVFWTKKHLRQVFEQCEVPGELVAGQDWNAYKIRIVEPIVNSLNTSPAGLGILRRVLAETLNYKDGDHLLWLEDGKRRKEDAERSLEHLRLLVDKHDAEMKQAKEDQDRRRREYEERKTKAAFNQRLGELRGRFLAFHSSEDPQQRGRDLEGILYDLFVLFDLEPRGAFRLKGEQIDGAFALDGNPFLLEAKWQSDPVNLEALRDLDGAVAANLDNTLGLFVSINGFSPEALERYRQGNRPRIICMDGHDTVCVLEGRIDLSDLLRRKRTIASQRGDIFTSVTQIMAGGV